MDDLVKIGPLARELYIFLKNDLNFQINNTVKGMTQTKGLIIYNISKAEKENSMLFQKDLEKILNVNKSTMSEMLDSLEDSGIIKRVPLFSDARKKEIILTEYGKKIDSELHSVVLDYENGLREKLSKEEYDNFISTIYKLMEV